MIPSLQGNRAALRYSEELVQHDYQRYLDTDASVSLSLRQPLWIGEGLVDLSYQDKQVEKQRIALSDALYTKEGLQSALIMQNIRLLLLRQSLLENRYILSERVALADTAKKTGPKKMIWMRA